MIFWPKLKPMISTSPSFLNSGLNNNFMKTRWCKLKTMTPRNWPRSLTTGQPVFGPTACAKRKQGTLGPHCFLCPISIQNWGRDRIYRRTPCLRKLLDDIERFFDTQGFFGVREVGPISCPITILWTSTGGPSNFISWGLRNGKSFDSRWWMWVAGVIIYVVLGWLVTSLHVISWTVDEFHHDTDVALGQMIGKTAVVWSNVGPITKYKWGYTSICTRSIRTTPFTTGRGPPCTVPKDHDGQRLRKPKGGCWHGIQVFEYPSMPVSILASGSHVHSQKVKGPLVNNYPYNPCMMYLHVFTYIYHKNQPFT